MAFRRLGGTRDLRVNVRLIAATNKDLAAEVTRGRFRLDLYHRLDVFHLELPTLRERRDDIVPLANHFLRMFSQRMKKPGLVFPPEVDHLLRSYDYAGNVRELKNMVERAVILSTGKVIGTECIVVSGPTASTYGRDPFFYVDMEDGAVPAWEQMERRYVARVLDYANGNRSQAARILEVSYPTVAKKIGELAGRTS